MRKRITYKITALTHEEQKEVVLTEIVQEGHDWVERLLKVGDFHFGAKITKIEKIVPFIGIA